MIENTPTPVLMARNAAIMNAFNAIVVGLDENDPASANTMRAINGVALLVVASNQAFAQPDRDIAVGCARSMQTMLSDLACTATDATRHDVYTLALNIFEGNN